MLFQSVLVDIGDQMRNKSPQDQYLRKAATCVSDCFSRYLKSIRFKCDELGHLRIRIIQGKDHLTRRKRDKHEDGRHYLEYELDLAKLESVDVFEFFVDFVEGILVEYVGDTQSHINEVVSIASRIKCDRELFRIPFRSLDLKKFHVDLFFLAREGIKNYYQLFMEVTWKETGVTRTYFVLEDYYQCMVALVSRISLKGDIISFVPGKSDNARHNQRDFVKRGFDVPVTVDLSTKKPYRF